jgi:hypothetical protein
MREVLVAGHPKQPEPDKRCQECGEPIGRCMTLERELAEERAARADAHAAVQRADRLARKGDYKGAYRAVREAIEGRPRRRGRPPGDSRSIAILWRQMTETDGITELRVGSWERIWSRHAEMLRTGRRSWPQADALCDPEGVVKFPCPSPVPPRQALAVLRTFAGVGEERALKLLRKQGISTKGISASHRPRRAAKRGRK